jgi:hypothetical protein
MATTIFDLSEASFNGAWSGWIEQSNGGVSGSRIDADATTLIPGMLTLKSQVVSGSTVSVDGGSTFQERADIYYNGGAGPSPAGPTGIAAGVTQWWRWAQKTAADYVPQNDGTTPRWNNYGGEFHNTGSGPQANVQVLVDAGLTKLGIDINGGVAASWPGSGTQRQYNIFDFVAGELLDFIMQVKWASDGTGFVNIWVSRNGGSYTQYVADTGPNLWVSEGAYPKMANYRRTGASGHTNIVYFTGLLRGASLADLAVPTQGQSQIGDSVTTGTALGTSSVGEKRSTKITFTENGTVTHLSFWASLPGLSTGKIATTGAIWADSAGAPGAKLAQTREHAVFDGASPTSFWHTTALATPLAVTAGQSVWIGIGFGIGATGYQYATHASAGSNYASNADTYTAVGGLADPFGASTTGNALRTMVGLAYYAAQIVQTATTFNPRLHRRRRR